MAESNYFHYNFSSFPAKARGDVATGCLSIYLGIKTVGYCHQISSIISHLIRVRKPQFYILNGLIHSSRSLDSRIRQRSRLCRRSEAAVAQKLKSEGFSVAASGRSIDTTELKNEGYLSIKADFSNAEAITGIFDQVERSLDQRHFVLYNAYSLKFFPAEDPLSLPFSDFYQDAVVIGINVYAAAQRALKGFDKLPADVPKAFISNGNKAARDIIQVAANAYGPSGKRFYYSYQVTSEGKGVAGENEKYWDLQEHADTFYRLWKQAEQ
ncbi:hypothetical protein FRC03_012799, partial [Tulasnella sp. 419]